MIESAENNHVVFCTLWHYTTAAADYIHDAVDIFIMTFAEHAIDLKLFSTLSFSFSIILYVFNSCKNHELSICKSCDKFGRNKYTHREMLIYFLFTFNVQKKINCLTVSFAYHQRLYQFVLIDIDKIDLTTSPLFRPINRVIK